MQEKYACSVFPVKFFPMKHASSPDASQDNDALARAELAEALNDSSIDRIMAVDTSLRILAWNKMHAFLSGIPKEAAIGRHLYEVLPAVQQQAPVTEAIQRALQGHTFFLPSGSTAYPDKYYENHFIPLKNAGGVITGVLNIMHDVSHRVKAEQQLQQLNHSLGVQNRELERVNQELAIFANITGHDLKEPLHYVYEAIETIIRKEAMKLTNFSRANLRKIQAAVRKMNLLTDDVLSLTNIYNREEEVCNVDLDDVLRRSIHQLEDKITSHQVTISRVASWPVIQGNAEQLAQLFYHLLDNSVKFQPPEQIPEINIYWNEASEQELAAANLVQGQRYIKISIADNGIGFDQSQLTRLFQLFEKMHTSKEYRGTGKGLAICKKIAEAHQGYITAESQEGSGSVFYCYLPVNTLRHQLWMAGKEV